MTYILNAICVDQSAPLDLRSGAVVAEIDEPAKAGLEIAPWAVEGIRYLLVVDDGSGYMSSQDFAQVPEHAEQPTVLHIPAKWRVDVRAVLNELLAASPVHRLAIYLEANRALSRSDVEEPYPVRPERRTFSTLDHFWAAELAGEIEEECVALIVSRTSDRGLTSNF